ncbi:helix-turn-helix domain-containing protein [Desulfosudis oleivorans]|uniref:Transcriptional regulator, XRE family n=1 Tax=Desulfosudis oleivorans (strain DSM 6200 / JCM 39069 / Hxd3) TaxID=96561 RepID=A8ZXD5_DESOH|nr:helix-turn-helix transcriptional regulator [Desulfosudis oleivorans]ABW68514.1 transcriptional regulator, XRE family [Desulfosudis oleivorans Hxd3]
MDNELLKKRLGIRLKELRLAKNLKQEDIEKKHGFNYRYYGRLERGEINPSLETLNKLCEIFDVSLAALFQFLNPDDKLSTERESISVKVSQILNNAGAAKLKKIKIFLDDIL